MIILDTDHAAILLFRSDSKYEALANRLLNSSNPDLYLSVIMLEEQFDGWTAELRRRKRVEDHVSIYSRLTELIDFYSNWRIASFDDLSVVIYRQLRSQKIRIGAHDLKIASIALANDAMLLSANLVDFERVPNLKVADWLYT